MNKQLLSLLAVVTVFGGAVAKEQKAKYDFTFTNAISDSISNVKLSYCRGTSVTKYVHYNHDLTIARLEDGFEVKFNLDGTKKVRLQKLAFETADEIVVITFEDNKVKLPAIVVLKEDGLYVDGKKVAEYKERKVVKKAAVVAVKAAQTA